jgi:hypothetical protein
MGLLSADVKSNSNEATCVCVLRACRTLGCLFAPQLLGKDIVRLKVSVPKARDLMRGEPLVMIGLNESRRLPVNLHLE